MGPATPKVISRLLKDPLPPRLLKKAQMQGGAPILRMGTRGRVRGTERYAATSA